MGHHSVLEHVSVTFAIDGMSRSCSHQLVRHRLTSFSQQSQRYVQFDGANLKTVMPDSIKNKANLKESYDIFMEQVSEFYEFLLDEGVPREDARFVLPNACCTNLVMTVNVRQLIEMCKLRMCSTAQWEIRAMFLIIKNIILYDKHLSFLWRYLNPKCDWLLYCPEGDRCCGRHKVNKPNTSGMLRWEQE